MPTTLTTALSAVYGVLHADSAFMALLTAVNAELDGLYARIAPQGAQPVYCVIGQQSPGQDTLTINATRILSRPLVRVEVNGPASSKATIEAAYARADALLQPSGRPLLNAGGSMAIWREGAIDLTAPELVNSEAWLQFGGLYRVQLPAL